MAYDPCRFPALFLRKTGPLELYGLPANSRRVNLGDFGNYDRLQTGSGFQNKFYGLGLFGRAFFLVLGSCTLRRWCVSVWMRICSGVVGRVPKEAEIVRIPRRSADVQDVDSWIIPFLL